MKIFLSTIMTMFLWVSPALAHEEGTEVTNVAGSDWIGPLVAVVIIAAAIILARKIRNKKNKSK